MRLKRISLIFIALLIILALTGCRAFLGRVVPGSAAPGSVVKLKGFWFGDEPGESNVYFGEKKADITLWGKREIFVKVPEGTGIVEVFVEKDGKMSKGSEFTYPEEEYEVLGNTVTTKKGAVLEVEGAAVTVPPSAVEMESELKISRVVNAPLHDEDLYMDSQVYKIEIEDYSDFNDFLMLEFEVEKGMEDSNFIVAAYWDENTNDWVQAPSHHDEDKGTVRVYTDHLTNWRLLALKKIYDIHETDHFIIAYNKRDKSDVPGIKDAKKTSGLAVHVGEALDESYLKYRSEIGDTNSPEYFMTEVETTAVTLNPSSWFRDNKEIIDTRLIVRMSSSYNKFGAEYSWTTGQLMIPTKYADEKDLKTTAAHELFHAFQNHRLMVFQMSKARWLMEATAEYAGYYAGNSYGLDRLHTYAALNKNLEYFENREEGHEYGMSAYIRYLIGKGADFGDLWNSIVAGKSDPGEAFDSYVKSATGESNHTNYRVFWQKVLTDANMPDFSVTGIGVKARSVGAGKTLKTQLIIKNDWSTGALLTTPRKYNSDGTRTLIIEADGTLPSTALVEAFRVNDFDKKTFIHDRVDGGEKSIGILGPLYPFISVQFTKSMNQAVYITGFGSEAGNIGIKVSDISLKISPDNLEDAEPYKMYRIKAVASNIPTSITNITVKWELADGTFLKYDEFENKRGRIKDTLAYEFEEGNLQDIKVIFDDADSGRNITSGILKVSDTKIINISHDPSNPSAGEEVLLKADGQKDWFYKWDTGSGATASGKGGDETTATYNDAGRHRVTVKAYSDSAMTKSVGFGTTVIEIEGVEPQVSEEPKPTEEPQQTETASRWVVFDRDAYLPGERLNVEIETNAGNGTTYESINYYKWSAKPADEATLDAYIEARGKSELYTDKSGSPQTMAPEVPGRYEVTGTYVQDPSVTVSGIFEVKDGMDGKWRRTTYVYREDGQNDQTTTSSEDSRITTRTVGNSTKLTYDVTSTTSYPDGTVKIKKYHMEWSDLPEVLVPGEVITLSFTSTYEGEDSKYSSRCGLAVFYNERGSDIGLESDSSYAGWDSGSETIDVGFRVPAYGSIGNAAGKLDIISGVGLHTENEDSYIPSNYIYRVLASYSYEEDGRTYGN